MKRPRLLAALAFVALFILSVWALRLRIAAALVERRLAAAGVDADYRVTRIGPFLERMEDVRIGDPTRPDLIGRRIDVTIGYGLLGPFVRGIAVDGVRLTARIDTDGLHLGALDRLLPKSGGKVTLPDIDTDLHDVSVRLATPNGALRFALEGRGNPMRRFDGRARADAALLRLASCSLGKVDADVAIAIPAGAPRVRGPVRIMGTGCPGLALGGGSLQIDAASSAAFDRVTIEARPSGFAGAAGPARFTGVSGSIAAAGSLGHLKAQGALTLAHLALPDQAAAMRRLAIPAALPITPAASRAANAATKLLGDATARVEFEGAIDGLQTAVRVHRAMLIGAGGARISATGGTGLTWAPAGWQIDADLASGGGDLPSLRVRVRQPDKGAPLRAAGRLDPYQAGHARIAAPRLNLTWDGHSARFGLLAEMDGPLGNGFVRGLSVPVDGRIDGDGSISINDGCRDVAVRELRLSGFSLDPARLRVCGQPLARRTAGGPLRLAATIVPLRLNGRSGGSPLSVTADGVWLSERGFEAKSLLATIGAPDRLTRLAVARIEGSWGATGLGGTFANAAGAIANVPLDLTGAAGDWAVRGGALAIRAGLTVSDQAPAPRFLPLDATDVRLDLADGRISASGILRQPERGVEIARVALAHDLGAGAGHADLDVAGIAFRPKGLQPDTLTPLTLGVVANVAGSVSGHGRIDWSAAGVTSHGTFGTDRLDLAAAFGPVTGIKGQVVFTDLLGLVSAPSQTATIAEVNTGVVVTDGTVHYQLTGNNRVRVEDAMFPFAGGQLLLDPATLDFGNAAERRLTFRVKAVDAAAFIQQLDFPNISATGTFDGALPMIFDDNGGRIEQGYIAARGGGTLAYVGELSSAQIGTMGKLAFDALKAIRYSALDISLDGRLDGEMVSRVRFTGIREATPDQSLIARLIRNLPFRFNISIRAPFRGLMGTARAYMDPSLLLDRVRPAPPTKTTQAERPIQTPVSGDVR